MPDEPLQLLIAEDQPVFRDGLRASLANASDVEIVAEAALTPLRPHVGRCVGRPQRRELGIELRPRHDL